MTTIVEIKIPSRNDKRVALIKQRIEEQEDGSRRWVKVEEQILDRGASATEYVTREQRLVLEEREG